MKKFTIAIAVTLMLGVGSLQAQEVPQAIVDYVQDRVDGEWKVQCTGSRTDGANPGQDWTVSNGQMSYIGYGIFSHSLINYMNTSTLDAANSTFEKMSIDTRLMIVE